MTMLDELVALGWPRELITLAEWDTLPEDEAARLECQEGLIQVLPSPDPIHQLAMFRIATLLQGHLPQGLVAVPDCDVLLTEEPLTVRRPDVLVVPIAAVRRRHRLAADEVLLVVEVVSPGSRRIDRVLKASEYADAGIVDYWILDLDEPSLTVLHLDGPGYRAITVVRDRAEVATCDTTVSIDLATLLST